MLTPEDLAARTRRAVDAATEAGCGLGLDVTDPAILYDVFSVVVHLAPAPVVVRSGGYSMTFWRLHTPDGALDAYDAAAARPVDRELVTVMEAARLVQLVACFALVPQLPMLAEGMRPALESWRAAPVVAL